MDQDIINWIFAGACAAIGFWVRVVWESLKDLRKSDEQLADKVSRIEVLVAGNYVKRDEFDRAIHRLFEKLDTIELKLSDKVDR